MKQTNFNALFPNGLIFGNPQNNGEPSLSVLQLLPQDQQMYAPKPPGTISTITTQDMVPGDWVYMKNTPKYTGQYWNGENAIYMGTYDQLAGGVPVWKVGATPRFSGLGGNTPLHDLSAGKLRSDLWAAYFQSVNPPQTKIPPVPDGSGIRWTVDVGPGTTNY